MFSNDIAIYLIYEVTGSLDYELFFSFDDLKHPHCNERYYLYFKGIYQQRLTLLKNQHNLILNDINFSSIHTSDYKPIIKKKDIKYAINIKSFIK